MLERANNAMEGLLRVILVRAQKRKRKAVEKASILENTNSYVQNVGRNMDHKGISDEVSGRNEAHVVRQCRKDSTCYKMVKILFTMFTF